MILNPYIQKAESLVAAAFGLRGGLFGSAICATPVPPSSLIPIYSNGTVTQMLPTPLGVECILYGLTGINEGPAQRITIGGVGNLGERIELMVGAMQSFHWSTQFGMPFYNGLDIRGSDPDDGFSATALIGFPYNEEVLARGQTLALGTSESDRLTVTLDEPALLTKVIFTNGNSQMGSHRCNIYTEAAAGGTLVLESVSGQFAALEGVCLPTGFAMSSTYVFRQTTAGVNGGEATVSLMGIKASRFLNQFS